MVLSQMLALKVGGEGMIGFYDQILPSIANKLGKRFGARVLDSVISNGQYKIRLKNNGYYEIG